MTSRTPNTIAIVSAVALVATTIASSVALGQGVPANVQPQINPGSISNENRRNEQQIREQTDQVLQGPAVIKPSVPASAIGPAGGATFRLDGVTFDSSAFLSKDELDAIAQKYIGTKVDISHIQRIVKGVNDLYAEKGIVTASAILPPQDLKKGGVLHVALIEGKLDKVNVTGADRLSTDFVRGHIATKQGEVVDVPLLTREVGAFNKTGVAQIQASLASGVSFGLTDINLAVIEPPALTVQVFGDNQGIESVGKYEGGFLIQGYSPLKMDDRLTLYGVGSRGNLDGNVAYSIPFDLTGGRVGLSYTRGKIYVVQGPFVPLNIKGNSDNAAFNLTQPVFVNANWFLLANGALSRNDSSSTQSAIPITGNRTNKETAGFSVGWSNETYAASVTPTYSAAQTSFHVTDTNQHFSLYNGSYSASARLPLDFVATLGGAFQVSSAKLISGDQLFQIGGPTTVRGYTTAIVAGSTGYYVNLEVHHNLSPFAPGLDGFAFYDRGSVYSTSPAVVTLNSAGVGLSYNFQKRLLAEFSLGVPLDRIVTNQPPLEAYFRLTASFSSNDFVGVAN